MRHNETGEPDSSARTSFGLANQSHGAKGVRRPWSEKGFKMLKYNFANVFDPSARHAILGWAIMTF